MTHRPDRDALKVLISSLEARIPGLQQQIDVADPSSDDLIAVLELIARLDAALGGEDPLRLRLEALRPRRGALAASLRSRFVPGLLEPLIERGDRVVGALGGEPAPEDDPVPWARDLLAVAAVHPHLDPAGQAEVERVLAHAHTLIALYPERFVALPALAADRFELEAPGEQGGLIVQLLELFGRVPYRALEQQVLSAPGDAPLAPFLQRALAQRSAEVIPIHGHPRFTAARAPGVEHGAAWVGLTLHGPPEERLAAASSELPEVDDAAWVVLHEDERWLIEATELSEAQGGTSLLLRIHADEAQQDALAQARILSPDGAAVPTRTLRFEGASWWVEPRARGGLVIELPGLSIPVQIERPGS